MLQRTAQEPPPTRVSWRKCGPAAAVHLQIHPAADGSGPAASPVLDAAPAAAAVREHGSPDKSCSTQMTYFWMSSRSRITWTAGAGRTTYGRAVQKRPRRAAARTPLAAHTGWRQLLEQGGKEGGGGGAGESRDERMQRRPKGARWRDAVQQHYTKKRTSAALRRCRTSRYEEGSSIM